MSQQEKTLVKQKLFGKGGMKNEDFNIGEFASDNVASALYRVFVEGVQKEEDPIVLTYMEKLETGEHRKYKVRVTGKDGRSYVRYADRQKINDLRSNPNIESVEMTGYGEPYEGEKKKGEMTAKAKRGDRLDPVGQEDKDIDNDGDHDKTDKYLLNRRKVRGAAIAKKSVKEGYSNWREDLSEILEVVSKDNGDEKITEKAVKNKIKINPNIGEAVENLGGTLLEMVEVDEVDYIVESVYDELLEEGYEEDDIEEALEFALTEAKVTFGHDTPTGEKKRGNLVVS